MDWNNLLSKESITEKFLHKNIDPHKMGVEVLSDAMDDPTSLPDDIDAAPGDEDKKDEDFEEIEQQPEDGDQDDGDSEMDEGSSDEDTDSGDMDSDSSDDTNDAVTREIRNNPLDKANGIVLVVDSFSDLETKISNAIDKLSESPYVSHEQLGELRNLLVIVQKDKKSAALSTVNESLFRYEVSKKLFIRYVEKLIKSIDKKKSADNTTTKKKKEK